MKNFLLLLLFFSTSSIFANNVQITTVGFDAPTNKLSFTLTWENSWRSGTEFQDAVWLFVKQAPNGGTSWLPATVGSATATAPFEADVSSDQLGLFVKRTFDGNGSVTTKLDVIINNLQGDFQDFKIFGIEMVYVPQGAFNLGDGVSDRSFVAGNDSLASFIVNSENAMKKGTSSSDFQGGGTNNDIPASFPKGFNAFYCMKYPISQGQYVDFLNCLSRAQQDTRTAVDLSGSTITNTFVMVDFPFPINGNVIRCDENIGNGPINFYCDLNNNDTPNENDDGQFHFANYISGNDASAYLDWSGLAPMTSLEYEKACRGPLPAVAYEFAWGSAESNEAGGLLNEGTADEVYDITGSLKGVVGPTAISEAVRVGLNATSTSDSRDLSGGSYYGIMDLSGKLNNAVIAPIISDLYTGEEGDGNLNVLGGANFTTVELKWQGKALNSTVMDRGRVSSYNGITTLNDFRAQGASFRGIKRL